MYYVRKQQAGFTLIELLVAIGCLIIIIGVAVLCLRPKDYSPQTRNAQRWADLSQLASGLKAYAAANGTMPDIITAKNQVLGSETKEGAIDLCPYLVPKYLKKIPVDPRGLDYQNKNCNAKDPSYVSGYAAQRYLDGSVVLNAFLAENRELITLRVPAPAPLPTPVVTNPD